MTLASGTRLGPYEVLGPLGAGGMGEVYRTRDARLGREVAIKVLPAALASNPERLKRFEREARSASALNHPNIVTIYEVGSENGVSYIAMELVKGSTLRDLLAAGSLPIVRLLAIATQIAEGLAKAHAAGIVHRDLKPENVMVTEDGHVKILDFGLAKLTEPDSSASGRTQAPTVSGATEEGVILGTVGYMSPEQATGGPIDYRSDQFSFGSILYEMATGRRAFVRGSAPETLTAIIRDEPEPIAAINPKVPVPVRWIIERCLAKEPRSRYTSTDDLARDLATLRDRLSEATSAFGVVVAERVPARRRWRIMAAIVVAILLAVGVSGWLLRQRDYFWKNPLAGASFTRLTDWEGSEVDAAISSDGKFVTFLADRDGPFDAWVAQVGSDEFLNLTKGKFSEMYFDRTRNIGFSADDAHLWIRITKQDGAGSDSWSVPTIGGIPRPFLPNAMQLAWSPDRTRIAYFTFSPGDPIFVADSKGAGARQIFVEEPGIHDHFVTWSPDGRFVYFVRGKPTAPSDMDVWRIPSVGGTAERMTNHHSNVGYPTFIDGETLLYTAARADGSGSVLYAMSTNRRIPHAVSFGLEDYVSVAASSDGRRLVTTVANPTSQLWAAAILDGVVDESGARRFSLPAVRATAPRFGPDYLLFLSSRGGADGLWKFKDGSDTELWRGSQGSLAAAPAVSPNGKEISFVVRGERGARLYVMAEDGTGARRINDSLDVRDTPSWSPDGRWIAVVATENKKQPLYKVPVDGGAPVRVVDGVEFNPVWSPDGRFIVYSESHGGATIALRAVTPEGQPFALPDATVRLGGNRYRFLPNGKALVVVQGDYRHQDFRLLDLETGRYRQLTSLKPGYDIRGFDVSPDGNQIIFDRYRENSDVVLIDLPPR